MIVAVKPNIQIPHVLKFDDKDFVFNPTCDVPEQYGKALVTNKPNKFFEVTEKLNYSEYTVKDPFAGKTLEDLTSTLSDVQRSEILVLVKAMISGKKVVPKLQEPTNSEIDTKIIEKAQELVKPVVKKEKPVIEGEPVRINTRSSLEDVMLYAKQRGVTIPSDVTKKAEILEYVELYLKGKIK